MADAHAEKELVIFGLGHHGRMETVRRTERPSSELYKQRAFAKYAEAGFNELDVKGFGNDVPVIKGKYDGRKIGFCAIPYGLSYSWAMTEALKTAKAAVGIGFCGAVREDIKPETIILAREAAISSVATPNPSWKEKLTWGKSDKILTDAIANKIRKAGYETVEGKILSYINTAYGNEEFFRQAQENGFLGVEMETASLFQTANFEGVPVAAILIVSDNAREKSPYKSKKHFVDLVHELEDKGEQVKMEDIARNALLEVFKGK